MIDIVNASKSFGADENGIVHAVNSVTLHIDEGDIFGIIGFSGAGKSTLVRLINLLTRPDSGSVTVDGKCLTDLSPKELRRARKKIGMIFQGFNLMPSRTNLENVTFALDKSSLSKKEMNDKALSLLELVGIKDKANAYPRELSGGQKQRVAIARALAGDPKVLLCDEATSALDPQTTKSILDLIKDLNERLNITVVVITHEMAVIKEICRHVAVMDHGKVVEEGSILDIFARPKAELTQSFINTTSNMHKIDELIAIDSPVVALNKGEKVIRLSYTENKTSEPLISLATLKFHVTINILFANIEIIENAPIGITAAIIGGDELDISQALIFFRENNIKVEVLKDGSNN